MASIFEDKIFRGDKKIGYCVQNRFFDEDGRELGYFENNRIFNAAGREEGYIENDRVYRANGEVYDEVEKVREHVSRANYSEMPCAAVCLLFGWD